MPMIPVEYRAKDPDPKDRVGRREFRLTLDGVPAGAGTVILHPPDLIASFGEVEVGEGHTLTIEHQDFDVFNNPGKVRTKSVIPFPDVTGPDEPADGEFVLGGTAAAGAAAPETPAPTA